MKRVARVADRERWRRQQSLPTAERLDDVRNLLVTVAGFSAPVALAIHLGHPHANDPARILAVGLDAMGLGLGVFGAVVGVIVVSASAAALTSGLTLRGRRVARLQGELAARSARVRGNLVMLVRHVQAELTRLRHTSGPRVAYKILEERLQAFHSTLVRYRTEG